MTKLYGIEFSDDVVAALEWAGCASDECVASDLARVRAGGRLAVLAELLDGVESGLVEDSYREYVSTLAVHAEASE